jgi:hypothetical protein
MDKFRGLKKLLTEPMVLVLLLSGLFFLIFVYLVSLLEKFP